MWNCPGFTSLHVPDVLIYFTQVECFIPKVTLCISTAGQHRYGPSGSGHPQLLQVHGGHFDCVTHENIKCRENYNVSQSLRPTAKVATAKVLQAQRYFLVDSRLFGPWTHHTHGMTLPVFDSASALPRERSSLCIDLMNRAVRWHLLTAFCQVFVTSSYALRPFAERRGVQQEEKVHSTYYTHDIVTGKKIDYLMNLNTSRLLKSILIQVLFFFGVRHGACNLNIPSYVNN